MTLTILLNTEPQLMRHLHTVISGMFLVVAVWLFYRSVKGYIHNWEYTRLDKALSYTFIVNLYLQLIFGFFLMVSKLNGTGQVIATPEAPEKIVTNRFWSLEHIVLMLFALFIANLGLIFSSNTSVNREKFRKVLVYYAIAIVLIALSLGSTLLE